MYAIVFVRKVFADIFARFACAAGSPRAFPRTVLLREFYDIFFLNIRFSLRFSFTTSLFAPNKRDRRHLLLYRLFKPACVTPPAGRCKWRRPADRSVSLFFFFYCMLFFLTAPVRVVVVIAAGQARHGFRVRPRVLLFFRFSGVRESVRENALSPPSSARWRSRRPWYKQQRPR